MLKCMLELKKDSTHHLASHMDIFMWQSVAYFNLFSSNDFICTHWLFSLIKIINFIFVVLVVVTFIEMYFLGEVEYLYCAYSIQ